MPDTRSIGRMSSLFFSTGTLVCLAAGAAAAQGTASRVFFLPGAIEAAAAAAQVSQEPRRIPQLNTTPRGAAIQGEVRDAEGRTLAGVSVILRFLPQGNPNPTSWEKKTETNGDGIFRMFDLPQGDYHLKFEKEGFQPFEIRPIKLHASQVRVLGDVKLNPVSPEQRRWVAPTPACGPSAGLPGCPRDAEPLPPAESDGQPYEPGALTPTPPAPEEAAEPPAIPQQEPVPDRWFGVSMPEYDRYGKGGEFPYTKGRLIDPFSINKIKGDYPIIGQRTFFSFTGLSDTLFNGRRLPLPSNVSAARPGSTEFFGRGEQVVFVQNFRLTFDLFHGDTSFRPIDWRFRVTPAFNLNYINTREQGIINVDVRKGTNRYDAQVGLQEAFFEYKIRDLSPTFDFVSVRAGIQTFSSDFRGFLFFDEQPGVRVFGNLFNNRWEYNLAYFYMLEKDTNSGLNKFQHRNQQVFVANLYVQDFLVLGYTTQFSFHYNKDDAHVIFDENGFLVRPAPIGIVRTTQDGPINAHDVRALYLGWTGQGHIGRINVVHAFYQAFGEDSLNPVGGRKATINAQMAATELSIDKDWVRLRGAFFWASGDANPRDGRARGFDTIVDNPTFVGGIFSLWNREGIRLTGTGVTLVSPNSLVTSLRAAKEQSQANFVNPGIFIYNIGADIELTPKLRTLLNVNYLRFDRTEPLELLLFQAPIRHHIGFDYSIGFKYRPPLSDNIVLIAGASALNPAGGFRDIYTNKILFAFFANLRLTF